MSRFSRLAPAAVYDTAAELYHASDHGHPLCGAELEHPMLCLVHFEEAGPRCLTCIAEYLGEAAGPRCCSSRPASPPELGSLLP
jgi:hypothetical protein